VEAAVSEPWSNGPVEGQLNRLKMLKRQMYGRVGIELLRARLLPEPAGHNVAPKLRQNRFKYSATATSDPLRRHRIRPRKNRYRHGETISTGFVEPAINQT
jgi:hypothetical protein